jgi:class 3 adenylate cyclase/predicted ATPase
MKFCGQCATPLQRRCPHCGFENPPGFTFCGDCGRPLTGLPSAALPPQPDAQTEQVLSSVPSPHGRSPAEAERRQLTVMFCDLVGSTPLAERLDPEELRTVILAYQEACAQVIRHFDGYLARYVGDGLLVYFGYPVAHDNDAQRAVQAGVGIVTAMRPLNTQLQQTVPVLQELPLQVRIGIHTGLVVVGDMGGGGFRDPKAIVGETPNLAARLQGIAAPNTVVVSAPTAQLISGLFTSQALGPQPLKGVSVPMEAYRVLAEGEARSRFEVAVRTGLTPLVGREEELGLLRQRWNHAKAGAGQVVLLSGEPGIGKSRLVQELKEQLLHEGVTHMEFRCSPYHQNSALYPIIDYLQRLLQFARDDAPAVKLAKLQHTLSHYRFPHADTMPLLAALLSLPHPAGSPPLTVSPQSQKEKTHAALVAWLVEEAEQQPVYTTWEDVHWADPSTLEVLSLVVNQGPTARLYMLLTFRPEFTSPWGNRSHLSQLPLSRLGRRQVEAMVEGMTGGKALPPEVVQQIVAKTDGVPLFVEELTKTVVESGLLTAVDDHYEVSGPLPPLAIPSTLHASLLARLDRLATVREIAQLGATLGREFSYELLQAVSPLDEGTLQHGLQQLVEAELVYQRGLVPQARYLFKHALIQDTAYQSLLKSTRQQYHRQIAQVLEERFPETVETQPELVAQHYTEAGLIEQALPYWRRAGERASQRSAHAEAISHLTKGIELLKALPDTPERTQQELVLQLTLGTALIAIKGYGASEVEQTYLRARALCQQRGETPQLFLIVGGLCSVYMERAELTRARELAEQLLRLAQNVQHPVLLLGAHLALGVVLFYLGELASARQHIEQSLALYTPQEPHSYGSALDPGVIGFSQLAYVLYWLGYPDQALKSSQKAVTVARELAHPFSLVLALNFAAGVHRMRGELQPAHELEEARLALCSEQGLTQELAYGAILRGWALAAQGQEEGIVQMRQGLAAYRATGAELWRPYWLALLAETYGKIGQATEGLRVLVEALPAGERPRRRDLEAELHRVKGELLLRSQSQGPEAGVHPSAEVEQCFQQAIDLARQQQAKSWELRAVMSLSRLWRQQGKKDEARQLLAEIYGWFTEGFETKDLQEAKVLLAELA